MLRLSDRLAAPAHVVRGPYTMKVMRIDKVRDGSKVGVFIFCQQQAREWVTPLTCWETAERLLKNYATDPQTKELVDNLDIFILPSVNPDGSHYSRYDFAAQRRNLINHCAPGTFQDPLARNAWGVDLNRNNSVGSFFDGYDGADNNCVSDVYAGTGELSEPEIRNEHWIVDTFANIKFSINIHTYGGYFMWAPGSYIATGRVTLPAPNIGIERYFFDVADNILARIKEYRNTVIEPERTGPIARARSPSIRRPVRSRGPTSRAAASPASGPTTRPRAGRRRWSSPTATSA
jgi:murein tripeptide amidase MpaA